MNDRTTRPYARWLGHSGAGVLCLLVLGCVSNPPSADAMFGGWPQPQAPVGSAGAPGSLDGLYVGSANVEVNGNFICPLTMSITNFQVRGNIVRFGGFEGPIAPDGTVSAYFEGMQFNGRFQGPALTGHVDTTTGPETIARPLTTCVYGIAAHRASA